MTNEQKHTPGPWIVTEQSPIDGLNLQGLKSVCRNINGTWHTICEIVGETDAELIASAPELLAENETLRAQNAELVRVLQTAVSAQMTIAVKMGADWDNPFPETYRDAWVMEAKTILAKVQA